MRDYIIFSFSRQSGREHIIKNFEYMTLLIITVLFIGLMVGLLIGRFTSTSEIRLSSYDHATISDSEDAQTESHAAVGKLNINIATAKELAMLPGIGDTYAQRIVEYRKENGPFMKIDDLLKVKGIGQKRIAEISEYITVGG